MPLSSAQPERKKPQTQETSVKNLHNEDIEGIMILLGLGKGDIDYAGGGAGSRPLPPTRSLHALSGHVQDVHHETATRTPVANRT